MPLQTMDAVEIEAFLGEREAGVLALADGDHGYGIPVSFAYDGDRAAFHFRFGYAADSQKRRFVDATTTATFVVYDRTDGDWASVVAEGTLTALSSGAVDSAVEEAVRNLEIPFFEVHAGEASDLEFDVVRLEASKLTGIREG